MLFSEFNGMQYSWSKVGGQLPDNAVQKDFNRQLYIPNIQQIHSGDYECTVRQTNQGGQKSRSVSVPVEGTYKTGIQQRTTNPDCMTVVAQIDEHLSQLYEMLAKLKAIHAKCLTACACVCPPAVPYFTIPLRNQHVNQGEKLRWQCVADGVPALTYSWFRNGAELTREGLPTEDQDRCAKCILTYTACH